MQEESSHAADGEARALERIREQVRYITGGQPIPPCPGYLALDPPRSSTDDAVIEARLEEALWDLGADDVDPAEWSE